MILISPSTKKLYALAGVSTLLSVAVSEPTFGCTLLIIASIFLGLAIHLEGLYMMDVIDEDDDDDDSGLEEESNDEETSPRLN